VTQNQRRAISTAYDLGGDRKDIATALEVAKDHREVELIILMTAARMRVRAVAKPSPGESA
jgi:hypothetical protein